MTYVTGFIVVQNLDPVQNRADYFRATFLVHNYMFEVKTTFP